MSQGSQMMLVNHEAGIAENVSAQDTGELSSRHGVFGGCGGALHRSIGSQEGSERHYRCQMRRVNEPIASCGESLGMPDVSEEAIACRLPGGGAASCQAIFYSSIAAIHIQKEIESSLPLGRLAEEDVFSRKRLLQIALGLIAGRSKVCFTPMQCGGMQL